MSTEFDQRANAHRPTDPAAMSAEIGRLAAAGLTPRDIATALRLDIGMVIEALYGRGEAA